MRYLLLFIGIVVFSGCKSDKKKYIGIVSTEQNERLHIIDIDNTQKTKNLSLSYLFDSAGVIVLEDQDVLVGDISKMQIYGDLIFILDERFSKSLFIFNKKGQFIRSIGNVGPGPGEYLTPSDFTLDTKNEYIYILDISSRKINKYSFPTGDYLGQINIKDGTIIAHIQYNNGILYTDTYNTNPRIENIPLLRSLNINTSEVDLCWMDYKNYNKGWNEMYFTGKGVFYSRNRNKFKFAQLFMDTIMEVHDNKVLPFLALKSNNLTKETDIEKLKQDNNYDLGIVRMNKINYIQNFIEHKDLVYFNYSQGTSRWNVVYNTSKRECILANNLEDDLVYSKNSTTKLFPSFCCTDSTSVYSYIRSDHLDIIINAVKLNLLSPSLKGKEKLSKITEDSNPVIFYYE